MIIILNISHIFPSLLHRRYANISLLCEHQSVALALWWLLYRILFLPGDFLQYAARKHEPHHAFQFLQASCNTWTCDRRFVVPRVPQSPCKIAVFDHWSQERGEPQDNVAASLRIRLWCRLWPLSRPCRLPAMITISGPIHSHSGYISSDALRHP